MRKTKIVCTMGPAIANYETMVELVKAGMDVARFNFSHGTHEEHKIRIDMVRRAAKELGVRVALMLDNRGPEIRLGDFAEGKVYIEPGAEFTLTTEELLGDETQATVHYGAMPSEVEIGRRIMLDDGNIVLEVKQIEGQRIICTVIIGGDLSDHKKVNLPGAVVSLPAVGSKDVADIRFAVAQNMDFIAASFIRKAHDIWEIRKIIEEAGGDQKIIAKIESQEGLDNLDEIIKVVDGLMVARGDLGVEIPTENVPIMQKEMIRKSNLAGIPVITATQMLDSMIRNPRPTRAEASDVANAILDGSDAIMLSGETASGKYPVEAVLTMARIAVKTEESLMHGKKWIADDIGINPSITDAIGYAVCQTVKSLNAKAILTPTTSGYTARMIAKYHPDVNIIATTTSERVANQLVLTGGVTPLLSAPSDNSEDMVRNAIEAALDAGYLDNGDLVVLTAGVPIGTPGSTNMMQVMTVGDVLVQGMVVGGIKPITGKSVVALNPTEALSKMQKGDILVLHSMDADYIEAASLASAIITEEGGLSSSGVIVGLSMQIPVLVGASDATKLIPDGVIITMDAYNKVYRGRANNRQI